MEVCTLALPLGSFLASHPPPTEPAEGQKRLRPGEELEGSRGLPLKHPWRET